MFRKLDTVQDFRDFECEVGRAGGKFLSIVKVGIFFNGLTLMLLVLILAHSSSLPFPALTHSPSSSVRSGVPDDINKFTRSLCPT